MRKALWCVDYYHSSITGATKNTKMCVSVSYKMKIKSRKVWKKNFQTANEKEAFKKSCKHNGVKVLIVVFEKV